jgi:hypothetical protein
MIWLNKFLSPTDSFPLQRIGLRYMSATDDVKCAADHLVPMDRNKSRTG